jgi:hypothetical protein
VDHLGMKVPANLPADRLVLEYLSRVAQAGNRYLPKGARLAFVARTRARIERECGDGLGDAERVQAVLASLGEPEALVRQERARLDAQWVRRRAADREAGEAAAAAITAPLEYRPITSRWRPATDTRSLLSDPSKGQPGRPASEDSSAGRPGSWAGQRKGRIARLIAQQLARSSATGANTGPAGGAGPAGDAAVGGGAAGDAGPAGDAAPLPGPVAGAGSGPVPAGPVPAGPVPAGPVPAGSGAAGPVADAAPLAGPDVTAPLASPGADLAQVIPWAGDPGAAVTSQPARPDNAGRLARGAIMLRVAGAAFGRRAGPFGRNLAALARRHPLEAVAVVLLGIGGLLFPFPFWLLGGLLAVVSRRWGTREKWIALLGPVIFAVVGTVVTTVFVHGHANPVILYSRALRLDVGILLRAGSVLCAGYLVAQLRRGPAERVPPWRR